LKKIHVLKKSEYPRLIDCFFCYVLLRFATFAAFALLIVEGERIKSPRKKKESDVHVVYVITNNQQSSLGTFVV
jgi:hypothetical protein